MNINYSPVQNLLHFRPGKRAVGLLLACMFVLSSIDYACDQAVSLAVGQMLSGATLLPTIPH